MIGKGLRPSRNLLKIKARKKRICRMFCAYAHLLFEFYGYSENSD